MLGEVPQTTGGALLAVVGRLAVIIDIAQCTHGYILYICRKSITLF